MPYVFEFFDGNVKQFACDLSCSRCEGLNRSGHRCSRRVCVGTDLCWQHVQTMYKVKVKDSPIQGRGLFAHVPGAGNEIVFQIGEEIVPYKGELITAQQLQERYGELTGPYALANPGNSRFVDAACNRSLGSLANGSKGQVRANARYSMGLRGGLNYWCIKATRNIRNNLEIIAAYGRGYWGAQGRHATKRRR
jgi:hypothetical protein